MVAFSGLLNAIGSDNNPAFATPWYWHLVTGGFAFGMVFMATEPVSGAMTNTWQVGLRRIDRRHDGTHTGRQPGIPRGHYAGDLVF